MNLIVKLDQKVAWEFQDRYPDLSRDLIRKVGGMLAYSDVKNLLTACFRQHENGKIRSLEDFVAISITNQLGSNQDFAAQSESPDLRINRRINRLAEYLIGSARAGDSLVLRTVVEHDFFKNVLPGDVFQALKEAVSKNKISAVKILLEQVSFISENLKEVFSIACENDFVGMVNELKSHPELRPEDFKSGFIIACEKGALNVVRALSGSNDERLAGSDIGDGFKQACAHQRGRVVEILLEHPLLPVDDVKEAFKNSCMLGCMIVLNVLLADQRLKAQDLNAGFKLSCEKNRDLAAQLLSEDERLDLKEFRKGFIRACELGSFCVVKLLQNDDRVSKFTLVQAFQQACNHGWGRIVKMLKDHPLLDEEVVTTQFEEVCKAGLMSSVKALMDEVEITSDDVGAGFILACQNNHLEVAAELLHHRKLLKRHLREGLSVPYADIQVLRNTLTPTQQLDISMYQRHRKTLC